MRLTNEEIAKRFHEEYEVLAPKYGWETNTITQVAWNELSEESRALMVETVKNVFANWIIVGEAE